MAIFSRLQNRQIKNLTKASHYTVHHFQLKLVLFTH